MNDAISRYGDAAHVAMCRMGTIGTRITESVKGTSRVLDDLPLRRRYRTGPASIAREFLIPALSTAVSYDRAAGYFSSESLSLSARGLTGLIRNGGTMRLVASPVLSEADIAAIRDGYDRRDLVERAATEALRNTDVSSAIRDRLGFLAWMIEQRLLEIKLALVTPSDGIGIYHEKFGVIRDDLSSRVGFIGSSNESGGGWDANFESISVYRSWAPPEHEWIDDFERDFESLWENETPGLAVYDFPDAARRELLRFRPDTQPKWDPSEVSQSTNRLEIPPEIQLRDYQKGAIRSWFGSDGRGIFAMATGTGKTITAIATMAKLHESLAKNDTPLMIVVVVPFKHLVVQWDDELARFGVEALKCFESEALWRDQFSGEIAGVNSGSPFSIVVTTSSTFAGDAFQQQLSLLHVPLMLVADEVHNLGAPQLRTKLPPSARFRLGLSATPERHRDDAGTTAIFDYFGDIVAEFSLGRAIREGFLTPYEYFPVVVELDEEELEQYRALTAQIGRAMAVSGGDYDADAMADGPLKQLLIKRARLVGSAAGKLPALVSYLKEVDPSHTLVYCSDSRLDPLSDSPGPKQIDEVIRILAHDLRLRVARYTSETSTADRQRLRSDFAQGDLQVLAAIRCLDEGIDIPETRVAHILASSTNPRQFIQRRGRILRRFAGKELASLYDYIVVPPKDSLEDSDDATDRRLVRREMERVMEFARSAMNADTALHHLLGIRVQYDLLDMD